MVGRLDATPATAQAHGHLDASRPRRHRRPRPLLLAAVVAVVVSGFVWAAGWIPCDQLDSQPSCDVSMLPGPVDEVADLVELSGTDTHASAGELLLTTVVIDRDLTVLEWVRHRLDPDVAVLDRELLYPSGRTAEDARIENRILMSDSQLAAKVAALEHLDVDLAGLTAGAELVAVFPETPAEGVGLQQGDVVVAVDGLAVENADEAVQILAERAPGDDVLLEVDRADPDASPEVTVTLDGNPDDSQRPYVGVMLRDFQVLPWQIEIDAGNIGGPSAGLLFSLAIVDRVTPEDLTGGMVVAGTGTITADGVVGPIAGIVQKVVAAAAREAPADVFLAPAANFDDALAARPDTELVVVPVDDLDDAIVSLLALGGGSQPDDAVILGPDGVVAPVGIS